MKNYSQQIENFLELCLTETDLKLPVKRTGKVRDQYEIDDKVLLITTDRQSAFDRILASVPFKGQVLNQTSAWWFEQTKHIVKNHLISVPDPNVILAEKCEVLPIEFVVRGYITGTTNTALWTVYKSGAREYCGNKLPEGLLKNQKLQKNILTPTTKEKDHDRPIAPSEIVSEGWMSQKDLDQAGSFAMELFEFGQQKALETGLILVDTKYEFGKDRNGNIILIDEIHTPDSSRYWIASSYQERMEANLEPENIDKEFLRLWFVDHCDPYNDQELPPAPKELVMKLSKKYIYLYETITGNPFQFPTEGIPVMKRIKNNLKAIL